MLPPLFVYQLLQIPHDIDEKVAVGQIYQKKEAIDSRLPLFSQAYQTNSLKDYP